MMRIALTKGSLRVPPTYFAIQHAAELKTEFEFGFFTMAADIRDDAVAESIEIRDASSGTPFAAGRASWQRRERALPLLFGRMRRQVRNWAPDVVHQHFANWSQPAVAASRAQDVPLIVTVHGADVYVPLTPLSDRNMFGKPLLLWHQRSIQRAFDSASRILAVSEYLAATVVRAGAPADRVEVHYQGIDTELYRPVERVDGPPRVVFIGALSRAKGVRDLIAASVALINKIPHELVIVGDGPLRVEVEEAALQHSHIDVLGQVNREGVRSAIAGATLFVLPTQRSGPWREAAGLVSLEAQASGVPAIVYNSGGAPEMVNDGVTGIVVEEGNLPALEDAIKTVLTLSDSRWREMSMQARRFVVENRSLRRSAEELAEHYRDVVAQKRPGDPGVIR
ncbi:glycosyltransferase [Microbacterium sp. NPDC055903]